MSQLFRRAWRQLRFPALGSRCTFPALGASEFLPLAQSHIFWVVIVDYPGCGVSLTETISNPLKNQWAYFFTSLRLPETNYNRFRNSLSFCSFSKKKFQWFSKFITEWACPLKVMSCFWAKEIHQNITSKVFVVSWMCTVVGRHTILAGKIAWDTKSLDEPKRVQNSNQCKQHNLQKTWILFPWSLGTMIRNVVPVRQIGLLRRWRLPNKIINEKRA